MKKLTTEEFVAKAKTVHGDKYGYDKVDYRCAKAKVVISCKEHGNFKQTPANHLSGRGCPDCGRKKHDMNVMVTTDEFIARANVIHKNRYGYGNLDYEHSHTKAIITCPVHGDFWQKPNNHLKGHGCPKCRDEKNAIDRTMSAEEFITKANAIHNNKYGYGNLDYKRSHIKAIITCTVHGNFKQTPTNHLNGHGCPKCSTHWEGDSGFYLFEVTVGNETFFKFGRTKRSVETRMREHLKCKKDGYTQIDSIDTIYTIGLSCSVVEAHKVEGIIKERYKEHKYDGDMKFSGYTECYDKVIPRDEVIRIINEV